MLPLGVYLLTLIICFDRARWYSNHRRRIVLAAAASTDVVLMLSAITVGLPIPVQVTAFGAFLTLFCLVCHGELVRLRPAAAGLTKFYLTIALGGAMGGGFVGLAAPTWIVDVWEVRVIGLFGWILLTAVWISDRESPLHTGDRWHFALLLQIGV
jgi:hypothetical protein